MAHALNAHTAGKENWPDVDTCMCSMWLVSQLVSYQLCDMIWEPGEWMDTH